MTPLDQFKNRWLALMPVPYIDAVNTNVDTDELDEPWGSAYLQADTRSDVTMGSNPHVEETGEIVAALFARSGTGDAGLNAAVIALRQVFHGYMTTDNTLQFVAVVGPENVDPLADGEWWRLVFTVPYKVWSRRIEPVPVAFAQDWRG